MQQSPLPACAHHSSSAFPCWQSHTTSLPMPPLDGSSCPSVSGQDETIPARRDEFGQKANPRTCALGVPSEVEVRALITGDGQRSEWTISPVRASYRTTAGLGDEADVSPSPAPTAVFVHETASLVPSEEKQQQPLDVGKLPSTFPVTPWIRITARCGDFPSSASSKASPWELLRCG